MRKYPVSIAAGLALALCLCRPALAAPFPEGVKISAWARAEAESAYAAGLIPEGIDLGGDYTAPIRRGQFARLAVELTAAGTGTDTQTLLEIYGLADPAPDPDGEEPPAEDAEGPSEETEEKAPAETGEEPPAETEKEAPADAGEKTPEESPADAGGETGEKPPAEETPKIEPFADTDDPYILLAKQLGIAKGYAGGEFRPGSTLSRAEAAVMLQRCMAALGRTEANRAPQRFSDAYQIPRWAREAVKFASGRTTAAGKALMSGSGGQFRPRETYSVEQAILTMLRCYESRTVEGVSKNWRAAPGYDTVEITLSFGGDCTLGRGRAGSYAGSFDEMYDRMGPAYFFSNLKAFQTDDLSMVNFEPGVRRDPDGRQHRRGHRGQQPLRRLRRQGLAGHGQRPLALRGGVRL